MRPTYSQLKGTDFKIAKHDSKMKTNKRKVEERREIREAATRNTAKCVISELRGKGHKAEENTEN